LIFEGSYVKKVLPNDFRQFWMCDSAGFSVDDQNGFHLRVLQTFVQCALAYHAR
jgi:hypothetical protein